MTFDSTFWVAISFIIFFGVLVYFKIPQKVNDLLTKMISDIKNEIDESEKILEQAKKESEILIIEMNDKFHKSSENKKILSQNKINQMKEAAIKEIKNNAVKIAIDSVRKVISGSVDKSKLEALFEKNLNDTKEELKKINS